MPTRTIFVGGLQGDEGDADLRQLFENCGTIVSTRCFAPKTGERFGHGFVEFSQSAAVQAAISFRAGRRYRGNYLQVREAQDPVKQARKNAGGQAVTQVRVSDGRYTGTLKEWKGHYGWIVADELIDHPASKQHGGLVYMSNKDVDDVQCKVVGARVSFVTYVDPDGVGATQVRLEANVKRGNSSGTGSAAPVAPEPILAAPPEDAVPTPQLGKQRSGKWWHRLAGDCCPISLTPLEDLEYEPFGLNGTARHGAASAEEAMHWFDGMFLACSIVSRGKFEDPVSTRALAREECVRLDEHISARNAPRICVAEAFDLARLRSAGTATEGQLRRLKTLEGEAATWQRLFDEGGNVEGEAPAGARARGGRFAAALARASGALPSAQHESHVDTHKPNQGPAHGEQLSRQPHPGGPGPSGLNTSPASAGATGSVADAAEGSANEEVGRRRRWAKARSDR